MCQSFENGLVLASQNTLYRLQNEQLDELKTFSQKINSFQVIDVHRILLNLGNSDTHYIFDLDTKECTQFQDATPNKSDVIVTTAKGPLVQTPEGVGIWTPESLNYIPLKYESPFTGSSETESTLGLFKCLPIGNNRHLLWKTEAYTDTIQIEWNQTQNGVFQLKRNYTRRSTKN